MSSAESLSINELKIFQIDTHDFVETHTGSTYNTNI